MKNPTISPVLKRFPAGLLAAGWLAAMLVGCTATPSSPAPASPSLAPLVTLPATANPLPTVLPPSPANTQISLIPTRLPQTLSPMDAFYDAPPVVSLEINGRAQTGATGSYTWIAHREGGTALVAHSLDNPPTPVESLLAATPLHGKLHLGLPKPPEALTLSVTPPGMGMGLPAQSDPEFDLPGPMDDGLYIFELHASWNGLGSANFRFLVQIGPVGATLIPPAATAPGATPAAVEVSIPLLSPRLSTGKGTLTRIAVSPDGRWLAVDSSLGIYQYDSGSFAQAWFYQLDSPAADMHYSPGSDFLAFSTSRGEIRVLKAATGALQASMQTQESAFLSWAPDDARLVSAAACQTVTVWQAASGTKLKELRGEHCSEGYSGVRAAWSADGKRIYAALNQPIAWDADTYQPLDSFQAESLNAMDPEMLAAPAGSLLALYDGMGMDFINIVDGSTGKTLRVLEDKVNGGVVGLAWAPDGRRLAVSYGAGSGLLEIWDATSGKMLNKLQGYGPIEGMGWLPDGKSLAGVVCPDLSLCVVDVESGQALRSLKEHTPTATFLTWTEAGLVSTDGMTLTTWDVPTGKPAQQQKIGSLQNWITSWPPGGPQIFYFGGLDGKARIGTLQAQVSYEKSGDLFPYNQGWSADGARIAGPGAIWDTASGKISLNLPNLGNDRNPDTLAWSADGKTLAMGDSLYIEQVILVDAGTGAKLATLTAETGGLNPFLGGLAFSPDGKYLAACGSLMDPVTGNSNGMLLVWDLRTRKQVALLTAGMQSERMFSLAWSKDSRYLASSGGKGPIMIYDMQSYTPRAILRGHASQVKILAWSPDGRQLASLSADGILMLWQMP